MVDYRSATDFRSVASDLSRLDYGTSELWKDSSRIETTKKADVSSQRELHIECKFVLLEHCIGRQSQFTPLVCRLQQYPDITLEAQPPCPRFGLVEPHSHARSNEIPSKLLNSCKVYLLSRGVDCVLDRDKFKISADAYRRGAKLSFIVRVYTASEQCPNPRNSQGKYVLEVQRRQVQ